MSKYGPPLYVIKPLNSINIKNKINNIKNTSIKNTSIKNTSITNNINKDDLPVFTMQDVNELNDYVQSEIYDLYSQQSNHNNNIITKNEIKHLDFLLDKHEKIMELLTNATYYYNNFDKINQDPSVNVINKRLDLYYRYIIPYISVYNVNLDEITDMFAPCYGGKKRKNKHGRTNISRNNKSRNKKRKTKHKRKTYKK
jgi:hypothetical protein